MTLELTKEFHRRSSEDFELLLLSLQKNPETLHFFTDTRKEYFFLMNEAAFRAFLLLHQDLWEFDTLFSGFSSFARKQIIQSFLIEEIRQTGEIENIRSTRHDIFLIIKRAKGGNDRRISALVQGYELLLSGLPVPTDHTSLRKTYDLLFEGAIDEDDRPDGRYYRKGTVSITDGLSEIHRGIYPEEEIIRCMEDTFSLTQNASLDLFERLVLSHFLFETIHPFYDGNGRFGRFLLSQNLYQETGTALSFTISSSIGKRKSAYYRALEKSRIETEHGYLLPFALRFAKLLHEGFQEEIADLRKKKETIGSILDIPSLSRTENGIVRMIAEAGILSEYGITNEEIEREGGFRSRSISSTVRKCRELGKLEETKIGRYIYRKMKG